MDWQLALVVIFGMLLVLMLSGMHVAMSLLAVCLTGMYIYFGGLTGWDQLVVSMYTTCNTFLLLPIVLFVFMGELLFHSGISTLLLNAVDKFLGRLPGRLALLSVCTGTLFSTLTGTSMATVAMMGASLVPEMEGRGYKKAMSLGPILGSGGLAIMIPPSGLAVLLGAIAQTSIGQILIAIIVPGIIMATGYALYIIIRCLLQPSIAPAYNVARIPLREKFYDFIRYILPLGIVIFLVVGVIFLGIATPSEAAATGALGTIVLSIIYGKFNWLMLYESLKGTVEVGVMMLIIIAGASAFSQVLAFSGATQGLSGLIIHSPLSPIVIILSMMLLVLLLGTMMDVVAIMMITIPLFMPVIQGFGFNPIWFCVLFLLNMEMASTTPPFGVALFAMKAVAPEGTTMSDIYWSALPFLAVDALVMALLMVFPQIALFLLSYSAML